MGCIVCFGELLLCLGVFVCELLLQFLQLQVYVGGVEVNVGVLLFWLGYQVLMVGVVVGNLFGVYVLVELCWYGVDICYVYEVLGVWMGLYFFIIGVVQCVSEVVYDCVDLVFVCSIVGDYDWLVLLQGVYWLYLFGVSLVLGLEVVVVMLDVVCVVWQVGVCVFFDGNFCFRFWQCWGGDVQVVLYELFVQVDIVFVDYCDMEVVLDWLFM